MSRATPSLQPTTRPFAPILSETVAGLRKSPKELSPKWLYDEAGSRLFDMICELPEYYLTRAELEIMAAHASEMAAAIGPNSAVVEFGSGTSEKTRFLLDRLDALTYVPVDIAREQLLDTAADIARDYPALTVIPLCSDFTKPLVLPLLARLSNRRVVYFPGSTLGNFELGAACALLRSMAGLVGATGAVLIGFDLRKDVALMERAYNDSHGITARFNLNALRHLNRVLAADFPLDAFEHRAEWAPAASRIEMKLVSRRDIQVRLGAAVIDIARGEYIRTECCHKYADDAFSFLAAAGGFHVRQRWFDAKRQFSVQLLEPIAARTFFQERLVRDSLQSCTT